MNFGRLSVGSLLACLTMSSYAQWDPNNGDWLKSDTTDIRVMTWNVQDGICSSNNKDDSFSDWTGIVRIIASLRPDVLILQECADNTGNGTGGGMDSISTLENVADLLIHGGTDIYNGNVPVTSYVQLFTGTGYDLPHVYVSEANDGFNRNMIFSRYPFSDLNGGGATSSVFVLSPDEYQTGGNGGIRGYQFAEIDLPDELYAGDLVVGNGHLKAGGSSSDFDQRERASQNIAYLIDYYYNGAGTGVSDPNSRVALPSSGTILDENTPIVLGGDLNQSPGNGPAEFIARAEFLGGTDGTDQDRSDSSIDAASHPISGETSTQGSNSKLDYLIYQDSIATARRQFIFRSSGSGMSVGKLPSPVDTFPSNPLAASTFASDHRPLIIDFILPEAEITPCPPDFTGEGDLNFSDVSAFLAAFGKQDPSADFTGEGSFNFSDVSAFLNAFANGCP